MVRTVLSQHGLDALLVTHPPNLRYLAGFDGSAGALVVSMSACVLVVDGRYLTSARERVQEIEALGEIRVELAEGPVERTVARVVIDADVKRLGVEAAVMTLSRFEGLKEAIRLAAALHTTRTPPELTPTERVVERGRLKKDAVEVAILREAARRLSRVASEIPGRVRVGRTERAVAGDIEMAMRRAGFERPAFETIVASGPNSALPHARPGERVLQPSDGVVLDFGGVYDGYCVDLTRTVQLPPVTDRFRSLFEAVRAAHAAAVSVVKPGIPASDVDRAARDVLVAGGLGECFVHGTGHGLGLEVHEEPRVAKAGTARSDEILAAGMVFTIEPGAYVPGFAGVRIEDDMLVVDGGSQFLTDVPISLSVRGAGQD
jgi:Xaa-Pro aminopeptidase